MATVKIPNYSDEQVTILRTDYLTNPSRETVEALATKLGKSVRSIVAKLTKEQIYVKPESKSKDGGPVVKKDAAADAIAAMIGLSEPEADSLTKANKSALKKILTHLNVAKAQFEAFQTEETDLETKDE